MNRNKKITQAMALAMTGIMVANAGMGSVYASDTAAASVEEETEAVTEKETETEVETETETETEKKESTKEETVYVKASPSGETQEIIVSDWLKNTDGNTSISDKSDLTDIKNVKGDETFSQDGDTLTWDANGSDIYYQGTSTKSLPVSVNVTYYLDGKEISADDLAGKSGHVKMVYQYSNHMKQGEIYTPFVLFTGMILPGDNFSNVKVSNGKSISDGDKNIVIGVGLPGLEDSLKIKGSDVLDDLDIDLDIPESFEVEADVTDFSLSMSMTVATPLSLDDLDLDSIDDEDDLKDKIDELADAATQLVDGTSDLADGVQELKDGCTDLIDGINKLDDGAGDLNDGVQTLNNKKGDLISGINQLSDGLNQLNSKKGDLVKGVNQLSDGLNQLNDKKDDLVDGVDQLADGAKTLDTGAQSLKDGMDQLTDGITTLDQNRPALVKGLQALIDGVAQIEGKKKDLTEGAAAVSDGVSTVDTYLKKLAEGSSSLTAGLQQLLSTETQETLKNGLQTVSGGLQTMYQKVYAANHAITGVDESGSIPALTKGINDYVGGVDTLIAIISAQQPSQPSGGENQQPENSETTGQSAEQNQKPVTVSTNVTMDVSFADANADAIASLEASIAGDKAVLASLQDVKSQKNAIPNEMAKKFSNAYSTYSSQLDNCIAQMQSDIASQEATLAALKEKQTVTATQEVEVPAEDLISTQADTTGSTPAGGTESGSVTQPTSEQIMKMLSEKGKELTAGAAVLQGTMNDLEAGLKDLSEGAAKIYATLYGTEDGKTKGAVETMAEGSETITEGLTTLEKQVSTGLVPGSKAIADGVSALYTKGIDVIAAGLNQVGAKLPALNTGIQSLSKGASQLQKGTDSLKIGTSSLADGTKSLQDGAGTLADGVEKLADGGNQLKTGSKTLADGVKKLADGGNQLKAGGNTLASGVQQLADGSAQLKDGTSQLRDGGQDLDSGVDELLDGANDLKDGMEEFDEKAIQKIVDFADEDLQDMIDRLKEIRDAGDAYQLFTDGDQDSVGSVKFIIETASIGNDD